ncbi:50S ribosomal protein L10 [Desulfotalea psychrophila]|uniref:Large ribosomal subunit protein uL10 n=1 Tax=Desulfotalea psychrophila (strain LSv54 / DSM 12343) TaxID=177439 RepID=RL10_DESPS|nr:50S ribosomal protein L10 [Desulfotalea psychrophila]Q6AP80.1 RecName: Full=Large ribosomal subunit protein uL10; AltName: Full=50S ribosomal protein L10 [Desulfotalea psychrophila LSv54]CAG35844.1 related to 50S ribosomal protein L10 [Desulfotalea psychrophila LSv54]
MNRDDKAALVSQLNDSFGRAKLSVVADYCGLKVSELQQIRIELKGCDSEIRVAKNTLLKRAADGTGTAVLADDFTGTTAVITSYSDPVGPAKVLTQFAGGHEKFVIRSAALEGEKIGVDRLEALAKLPSREVLLGQLLSTWNNVPTGLVRVLSGVPRTFVYGLQALKDQKEQEGK